MKLNDFEIGQDFWIDTRDGFVKRRCTDKGTRTIAAIHLDSHTDDPTWFRGPPYAVAESVIDEDSMQVCYPEKPEIKGISTTQPKIVDEKNIAFDPLDTYRDFLYIDRDDFCDDTVERTKKVLWKRDIIPLIPTEYHSRVKWRVIAPKEWDPDKDPIDQKAFYFGVVMWEVGPLTIKEAK